MKPRHPIDCLGDLLAIAAAVAVACMAAVAFSQVPTSTYAIQTYEAAQ